ncbi:hypothetical protein AUK22_01880 [bacterium CG2_30_54_10]|nr:MAG: hypothetical protein AUK22_01880 [bacterium CG2_30_54_10]
MGSCRFCGATVSAGNTGNPYTLNGVFYDADCKICDKPVCTEKNCSYSWVTSSDAEIKVCRECLKFLGCERRQLSDAELERARLLCRQPALRSPAGGFLCPECHASSAVSVPLLEQFDFCHQCNKLLCQSCLGTGRFFFLSVRVRPPKRCYTEHPACRSCLAILSTFEATAHEKSRTCSICNKVVTHTRTAGEFIGIRACSNCGLEVCQTCSSSIVSGDSAIVRCSRCARLLGGFRRLLYPLNRLLSRK